MALVFGAVPAWSAPLVAANAGAPIRLAISESVVGDVNLTDARAAMQIWIKRMAQDLNLVLDPKVFNTAQEMAERLRRGQVDAVALNTVEYRQVAEWLDPSHIVNAAGASGLEQYLILVKQSSGVRQLADLKGRRLYALKSPKMCVAPSWLLTLLDEGRLGQTEDLFGTVTTDSKFSRVVLPVFFGQADACLTSRRGFETMCELNPQVGRDLKVLFSSPPLVVDFYIFRKNYESAYRERVIQAISKLNSSEAGRQLATLFQFHELTIRDASCLTSALGVLDAADRARAKPRGGGRKG